MPRPAEDSTTAEGDGGELRVTVDRRGAVLVVGVAGELDHDTAGELRAVLARPVGDGIDRVVVDLADLRFCDSTGLNLLLRARIEREEAGLRLELAGLRPMVARLFAITGADSVLRIHPDVRSALGSADLPDPPDLPEAPGTAPPTGPV
ncbi:STAS domain-containing protein [Kitasatospora sp. NPDC059088]|uniref:STAS domain-containing protein n=1 Tax=Kitasatospora sp. NPDC059088 TaxID=3346722 RepID=UPI0036A4F1DE